MPSLDLREKNWENDYQARQNFSAFLQIQVKTVLKALDLQKLFKKINFKWA